jgi:hypothetical protein
VRWGNPRYGFLLGWTVSPHLTLTLSAPRGGVGLQAGQLVLREQLRVLGEREVPDALHRLEAHARNLRRRRGRVLHGARVVILARQHEQLAAVGVDPADPLPRIPIPRVECDIAEEHRRPALPVRPGNVGAVFRRALRGTQRADPLRHEERLVDLRMRRPVRLPALDLLARFAGDDAGEGFRVAVRQFQTDLA